MDEYFAYGTTTSVSKYVERVQTFPAVTICNISPLDLSNPNTSTYVQAILTKYGLNSTISLNSSDYAIYMVRKYMDLIKSTAYSDSRGKLEYIKSLGYDLDSMLISCYFNGYACNSSDFYSHYTFEFGNCYIFNHDYGDSSDLKAVSQSGPSSGLQLELYAGYPG